MISDDDDDDADDDDYNDDHDDGQTMTATRMHVYNISNGIGQLYGDDGGDDGDVSDDVDDDVNSYPCELAQANIRNQSLLQTHLCGS